MAWFNEDGLYVKFGTEEADVVNVGMFSSNQENQVVEVFIDADNLKAHDDSDPTTVLSHNFRVPNRDYYLESGELVVLEAFAGSSATLTLGVHQTDGETATGWDADGIDATIDVGDIDAIGDTITCDGDLIGTILDVDEGPGLLTAEAGTASFTAGKAKLILKFRSLADSEH